MADPTDREIEDAIKAALGSVDVRQNFPNNLDEWLRTHGDGSSFSVLVLLVLRRITELENRITTLENNR